MKQFTDRDHNGSRKHVITLSIMCNVTCVAACKDTKCVHFDMIIK